MGNTFNTGRLINGLFVDASGNVGIGTTTPAEKLSVIGNIRIDNGAADGGQLVLASSGFSDWNLDNFSGRFRAYYGATERFTITASGAVGIGTNNPQSLLDVKGATPFIRITDSSVTGETGIIMDASGGFIRGGLTINYGTGEYKSYCGIAGNSYFQTFHTNGSERMRISSNGNVGIGKTAPDYLLDLYGTGANTTRIRVTGATNFSLLQTQNDSGALYIGMDSSTGGGFGYGNYTRLIWSTGAYPLIFSVNDAERMRIASSGNIGIGTNAPTTILTIRKPIDAAGYGNGTRMIDFKSYFTGYDTETVKASIYAGVSSISELRTDNGYLAFMTADSGVLYERMRIEKTGQIQIKQTGNTHNDGLSLYNTANNIWNFVSGGDGNLYLGYNGVSKGYFINTNGAYTGLSDVNKKKDFEESTIGLDAVLGLKPTLYRMKDQDESSEKDLGFIAQEVKDFIPQAYTESTNGNETFIGLTQMPIIAALVKSIQELNAKVTALENK